MDRTDTHIKIELKRETAERLKALGQMGDTYDDVINRLISKEVIENG